MYTISSIDYLENFETLSITVSGFTWQQSAFKQLLGWLIKLLPSTTLIEVLEGADKLMARLRVHDNELLLTIDYYSEAIWLEANDAQSQHQLQVLAAKLNDRLKK